MPGCVLHVNGGDFAVDQFLASASIKPYQVHHRGEPTRPAGKNYEHSGFRADVSAVDGELQTPIEDAILFLRRYETDLSRLAGMREVSDRRLDFGCFRREVAAQFEYLPPELLLLAGRLGIGIELSFYESTSLK
jgi:hypothetical protein